MIATDTGGMGVAATAAGAADTGRAPVAATIVARGTRAAGIAETCVTAPTVVGTPGADVTPAGATIAVDTARARVTIAVDTARARVAAPTVVDTGRGHVTGTVVVGVTSVGTPGAGAGTTAVGIAGMCVTATAARVADTGRARGMVQDVTSAAGTPVARVVTTAGGLWLGGVPRISGRGSRAAAQGLDGMTGGARFVGMSGVAMDARRRLGLGGMIR